MCACVRALVPLTPARCQAKRDALVHEYWPAAARGGAGPAGAGEGDEVPVEEAFADEVDLGPALSGRAQSRLRRCGPRVPVSALAEAVPEAAVSAWELKETEDEAAARQEAEEAEAERVRQAAAEAAARRAAEQAEWEAATAKERERREAEQREEEAARRAKEEAEEEVRREREAEEARLKQERAKAAQEAREREKERRRRREEEERRAKEEEEQRALDADPLKEVMEKRLKRSAVAPAGARPEEPTGTEGARAVGDLEHTLGITAAQCAVSHTWGLRWEAVRATERSLPLLVKLRRKEDVAAACAALVVRALRDTVPKVACAGARLARTLFDTGRDLPQDAAGAGQAGGAETEERAVLPASAAASPPSTSFTLPCHPSSPSLQVLMCWETGRRGRRARQTGSPQCVRAWRKRKLPAPPQQTGRRQQTAVKRPVPRPPRPLRAGRRPRGRGAGPGPDSAARSCPRASYASWCEVEAAPLPPPSVLMREAPANRRATW